MNIDEHNCDFISSSEQQRNNDQNTVLTARDRLASLGGFDTNLVREYTGRDAKHERRKLARAGAMVLLPALLSLFSSTCLLMPFVPNPVERTLISVVIAVIILWVDCAIVTTLSNSGRGGILARVVMSLFMSVTIAHSLITAVFGREISTRIESRLTSEQTAEAAKDAGELRDEEAATTQLNQRIAGDEALLEGFAPEAIAVRHSKAATARADELRNAALASEADQARGLNERKEPLLERKRALETQIEALINEMRKELQGQRESKSRGRGPQYRELEGRLKGLRQQEHALDVQLNGIDEEIKDMHGAKRNGDGIADVREATASAADSAGLAKLTAEESASKAQLQAEIADYRSLLDGVRTRRAQTQAQIKGLPEKYALSRHIDPLAQTQALISIGTDNPLLAVQIGSLLGLFLMLDMTPIMIKWTASKGYDRYLQSLQKDRDIESLPKEQAFDEAMTAVADKRADGLTEYGIRRVKGLEFFSPKPSDSRHVRQAKDKLGRELLWEIDETIRMKRDGRKEEKRQPLTTAMFSVISHAWGFAKEKLGLSSWL